MSKTYQVRAPFHSRSLGRAVLGGEYTPPTAEDAKDLVARGLLHPTPVAPPKAPKKKAGTGNGNGNGNGNGGGGDDTQAGGEGDDTLTGGDGDDTAAGGNGSDTPEGGAQ